MCEVDGLETCEDCIICPECVNGMQIKG